MSRRSVTLTEVAQVAGVHPATVSRTITRPNDVRPQTRARVQAALDQLGYQPNRAARRLRTGRADALGVIVPDVTNPFFSALLQEMQRAIAGDDKALLFADSRLDPDEERRLVDALGNEVDAIIVCSTVGLHQVSEAPPAPLVFVNRSVPGHPCALIDQAAIVRIAFEHLGELGHQRVAFANGPSSYWSCQQRVAELDRVERDLAIEVVRLGSFDPTIEGGAAAALALDPADSTGLVLFNDLMALGALGALRERGVDVPGSMSVVGSDGVALGGVPGVGLTTVAAPLDRLADGAVELARAAVQGARGDERRVEPALLLRSSTAAVR